jgi:hypothetical protein
LISEEKSKKREAEIIKEQIQFLHLLALALHSLRADKWVCNDLIITAVPHTIIKLIFNQLTN